MIYSRAFPSCSLGLLNVRSARRCLNSTRTEPGTTVRRSGGLRDLSSFFRFQFVGGTQFVGLENYIDVFQDERFLSAVWRVVIFSAVQVPVMLGISLFAALALDSGRLDGKNFFRLAVFLPYAVPGVVATLTCGASCTELGSPRQRLWDLSV